MGRGVRNIVLRGGGKKNILEGGKRGFGQNLIWGGGVKIIGEGGGSIYWHIKS